MSVTGAPTHIPKNQTALLAGGGLGNAVLFSIGKALRQAGNRVVYFAGYKKAQDVFKQDDIEAAADVKESFVYSCYNQDQPLDEVDFPHLRGRLKQNSVQEKLGNLWLTQIAPELAG